MLSLLSLLALLSLLPLLTLLPVLSDLALHLPLEFLGIAPQHLLLPLLLGSLRRSATLLLGEIFLAFGEFVELLERVVDILRLLLFGGGRGGLPRLVLVLFGIEFEIEKGGQIPCRSATATAATATAALSKGNLNLAEGGLGAQQGLERLLLVGDGLLPLLLLQLLGGGRHGFGSREHLLLEFAYSLHLIGQFARFQAPGECDGLVVEGGLGLRKQLRDFGRLLRGAVLIGLLFEGLGDDLLFAL